MRVALILAIGWALLAASLANAQIASGWWFNPAEPGRGFFIEQQGSTVFMAGFLYESSGRATWVSSAGPMAGMSYHGALDVYANGQSLTGPYRAPTKLPSPGSISIVFSDSSHATLTWPGGTIPIERFSIVPGGLGSPAASPESGWYWNAAQGGRGFAVEIQAGNIMLAGFMYDGTGNPIWYVSQGAMAAGTPAIFQGQWVQYANGQSLWGSFVPATIVNPQAGQVILQFNESTNATLTLPNGQHLELTRFRFAAPQGTGTPGTGGTGDIVRFLNQSTFGATEALVAQVRASGIPASLEAQLAMPTTDYPAFPYFPVRRPPECSADAANPNTPAAQCVRDNYTLFQLQLRFFQNALTAPDQLRQRAAWALSQILVTSGLKQQQAYAMGEYQRILMRHAFGNYRDLLHEVTLSPMMGLYLDMANNDKPNPQSGVKPNENYARELLQLFSIGVHLLGPDGSPQTDALGVPIPAYGQDEILGLSYALTGWTYAPAPPFVLPAYLMPKREHQALPATQHPGIAANPSHNPPYFGAPMIPVAANHDQSAKRLLNGFILAAGQSAEMELNTVLDLVFNHPNLGPFIGRQLIQKLVTSNPSPTYVARVAAAFDNNGAGVRGDMKAVWRAILLDPEARGDFKPEPSFGHLREPVLFVTGILRALNGSSDGVYLRDQTAAMQQAVFYPPSVFNYFPADFAVPGSSLHGPEFGVLNATTTFARFNFVNRLVYGNAIAPDATVPGASGTSLNLSWLQALADDPAQMIDTLNTIMFGGSMSAAMKDTILAAVQVVPAGDTLARARAAAYLAATAPQFQVIR